jgi:uncharacterized membrane protein
MVKKVKAEKIEANVEPTLEEIAESQKRAEALMEEQRQLKEKRMQAMELFQKKVNEAKNEAMFDGHMIDFYIGSTEPYGEIAIKMRIRELTPEEVEKVNAMRIQADLAKNPPIPA